MKTVLWLGLSAMMITGLSGCEQQVAMESVVHEDGSIDRTIVLSESDSAAVFNNIFDAGSAKGWETVVVPSKKGGGKNKEKGDVTFHKHYQSVAEANLETDAGVDTLFRVHSSFEKKFRWFYTYLRYSDTYRSVDRFRLSPKDYFTIEDHAFITRLPADGVPTSRADSLYVKGLNDKISDVYVARAYYEEAFEKLLTVMKDSKADKKWLDTLVRNKEKVYQQILKSSADDDKFIVAVLDSLKIPVPAGAIEKYHLLAKELENRMTFMFTASEGKYLHSIRMPWPVVTTNADSVQGTGLFWKPSVMKFQLSDYEMFAESRRLNYWAVLVSLVVVLAGGWFLWKGRGVKEKL